MRPSWSAESWSMVCLRASVPLGGSTLMMLINAVMALSTIAKSAWASIQ